MLLVVSFLLRLLVILIGLRVDTPNVLSPLAIQDTVLLFTKHRETQNARRKRRGETRENGEREVR